MIFGIIISIGLVLMFIGYLFWKRISIEVKGEDYDKVMEREKELEWLGENLVYFSLGILLVGGLYKFVTPFNTMITLGLIMLLTLVFAIRFYSR